ncbi:MAG: hypothetical protein ACR2M4_03575 [Actinomycetota bacterium]
MKRAEDEVDWSLTTWEGSRRAQLRRWLALTVRERLQAIEEITEVARRIGAIGARRGSSGAAGTPAHIYGGGKAAGLSEGPEDFNAPLPADIRTDFER